MRIVESAFPWLFSILVLERFVRACSHSRSPERSANHRLRVFNMLHAHVLDLLRREQPKLDLLNGA